MQDTRAAQLAKKIYQSHNRAIDFILEYREDPISLASSYMKDTLEGQAGQLEIVLDVQNKGWVRFVPKAWCVPANSGGTAWGANSRYVLCEICFWTKTVELQITVGAAPSDWVDKVWERAAKAPFKQEWKKRPAKFVEPFKSRSDIAVEQCVGMDPDEAKGRFKDWLSSELQTPCFQEAVVVMTDLIRQLPKQVGS